MITKKIKWLFGFILIIVFPCIFIINMGESVDLPPQFKSYPKRMNKLFYEDHGGKDLNEYIVFGELEFNGEQFCVDNKDGFNSTSPQQTFSYDFKDRDNFQKAILKVDGIINNAEFSNTLCVFNFHENKNALVYQIHVFKNGFLLRLSEDVFLIHDSTKGLNN